MSEKHAQASRKRWANVPPNIRSKLGKLLVSHRWKNTTKKQRQEVYQNLIKAKKKKNE